jgi:hypothetical protein
MQFWRMVGPFSMSVFAPAASASRVVRRLEVKSKRRRRH